MGSTIYDAYPLTLRSFLTAGPPPLERALSQQRLPTDDAMAARRMRELFDRPATVAEHATAPLPGAISGLTSPQAQAAPGSPMFQRSRAERRSASMFTRLGKFTGEVYETKERSRVINALKRRSRTTDQKTTTAASKFTADDVLRAGTLTKQGSWRRNWKSRFFLLRRDYPSLSYYKSEEKLELLGAISITGDTLVLDKSAAGGHAPYRFQLRTRDASLLLESETRDNQQRWMDACQELVDALRAEKFRQSTMSVDRDPTTAAAVRQSMGGGGGAGGRHSVATTVASSLTSLPNGSLLKARTPKRIGDDNQTQHDRNTGNERDLRRPSDLDQLLDGSSDSSSDEEDNDDCDEEDEDNQKEEDDEEDDEEEDDDIWATGRSHHVVLLDQPTTAATTTTAAANKSAAAAATTTTTPAHTTRRGSLQSSSSSRQRVPSNSPFFDVVVELVLGRQSKLLSRSESSNDKLSCSVKVMGYSSQTKQSIEIGSTDTVKIAAAVAQHQQAQTQAQNQSQSPVRITFSVVLRVDLSRFDQLRFTVYRTSSSASKPVTVGLGRLFADDDFKTLPQPRLVPLTEKSSSFPDVLASSRNEQHSLLSLHGTRGGNAGGSSSSLLTINGNAVQLVVQAFPAKSLHEVLPTGGIDMAATKYLLPTTLSGDSAESPRSRADNFSGYALIENGSFLTTTSEAPAPPDARLIVVDEILRVPRSTFALPLAFLDFLEETALERTRFLQKQIEASADTKSDNRQAASHDEGTVAMQVFELDFYRKKMEEYLKQRQFLMKQEKRLLDEAKDHKIFQYTADQVARMNHKTKSALKKEQAEASSDDMVAPFKRSTFKSLDLWQYLPTNMQNQFLCVHQPGASDKQPATIPFAWHTMTMGCPAAHTKGFANGGFPLLASIDPTASVRPSNLAASAYSDESDYGGPTASDNEHSLERGSALGTQLESLRRRASFNRPSNTNNNQTPALDAGAASIAGLKTRLELKERLDIIASQTLSAAIACLGASLDLAVLGSERHKLQLANATKFGYLVNFESLLSTQGKEVGMLEDFAAGAKWLRNVFVQFRRHNPSNAASGQYYSIKSYSPPERRGVDAPFNPSASLRDTTAAAAASSSTLPPCFLVTMGVSDAHLAVLPPLLAAGKPLRMRCVLFSQGVNEKQSLVHALKSQAVKVQDRINRENLEELKEIYAIFRQVHASDGDCVGRERISKTHSDLRGDNCISRYSLGTLDELLAQIEHHVCSSSNAFKKNVALLMDTSDFCRELGGARVTCCKSGKDRTAMSVTLEQARLCCSQLHVAQGQKLCATMRVAGVRRKNVFLNTKSNKFAFNEVQRKLLPDCYKPPMGTYKSGKT